MKPEQRVLGLVILIAAVLWWAGSGYLTSTGRSVQVFPEPESRVDTYVLDVSDTATKLSMTIEISLRQGTVVSYLVDPAGERRFRLDVHGPGQHLEIQHFDTYPGSWTLVVICRNTAGRFGVEWQGFQQSSEGRSSQ